MCARPELLAEGLNQLWSRDITKLKTTVKWTYVYLYVVLDVYSRYVVGWLLNTREAAGLARELVEQTAQREAAPSGQLTLHADRGARCVRRDWRSCSSIWALRPAFSRPRQSNDNSYSESFLKTNRHAPAFPACLAGIDYGRDFVTPFYKHSNHHHRHTSIGLMTPAAAFITGRPLASPTNRVDTLKAALDRYPHHFKGAYPNCRACRKRSTSTHPCSRPRHLTR